MFEVVEVFISCKCGLVFASGAASKIPNVKNVLTCQDKDHLSADRADGSERSGRQGSASEHS